MDIITILMSLGFLVSIAILIYAIKPNSKRR
ncbi:hypothetical protein SAM19_04754 [Brevibacillus laterosporus]|nr:hypothetical protein [Brevibacillus laterosporus]